MGSAIPRPPVPKQPHRSGRPTGPAPLLSRRPRSGTTGSGAAAVAVLVVGGGVRVGGHVLARRPLVVGVEEVLHVVDGLLGAVLGVVHRVLLSSPGGIRRRS